jgi:hypothetical protein
MKTIEHIVTSAKETLAEIVGTTRGAREHVHEQISGVGLLQRQPISEIPNLRGDNGN